MNRWLTRRWPALHWPSIRGRGRTDAGPLLLTAAVIAAVALLAGAVPALLRAAADDAVQDTVRRAGHDSNVLVHANWERDDGPTGGRVRMPRLAEDVDNFRARATYALGPDLDAALLPPVAAVNGPILNITDGSVPRTFQFTYLAGDLGGPDVTWVAGSPPGPAVSDEYVEAPYDGPPWPVQVGLSEVDAAALDLGPGDRIPVRDGQGQRQGRPDQRDLPTRGQRRPRLAARPGAAAPRARRRRRGDHPVRRPAVARVATGRPARHRRGPTAAHRPLRTRSRRAHLGRHRGARQPGGQAQGGLRLVERPRRSP